MIIYLVRHGETDWTRKQRLQGRRDIPLNEIGKQQLEETGRQLKALISKPDIMLSSPLSRARTSAEIIARSIGFPPEQIQIDTDFIERDFGKGEGTVIKDLGWKFPDDSFADMESIEDTCKRAGNAIEKLPKLYENKTVMVVAHGAILKAILAVVSKGAIQYQDQTLKIPPGSVYQLEYNQGKFESSRLL